MLCGRRSALSLSDLAAEQLVEALKKLRTSENERMKQSVHSNYLCLLSFLFVCLFVFFPVALCLVNSDVQVPDKQDSAVDTKPVSDRSCLPNGFVLCPTESSNAQTSFSSSSSSVI